MCCFPDYDQRAPARRHPCRAASGDRAFRTAVILYDIEGLSQAEVAIDAERSEKR
jgi:hypothetical protein